MVRVPQHWNRLPLLTVGVALLALFVVLLLSLMQRQSDQGGISISAQREDVVWRRLTDESGRFTLLYPAGWTVEEDATSLLLRPLAPSDTGAALELQLPPISDMLSGWETDAIRRADNVAVGGISGSETIYRVGRAARGGLGNSLLDALREMGAENATLVIWQSPEGQPERRVAMLDAETGSYLPLLEQIRDSIRWSVE